MAHMPVITNEIPKEFIEKYPAFVEEYRENVTECFNVRWWQITPDIHQVKKCTVVGGLMARQATLAIQMASNRGIWNKDVGSLILRSMVECHILMAWILFKDADLRCKMYIDDGVKKRGQYIEKFERYTQTEQPHSDELKDALARMKDEMEVLSAEWGTAGVSVSGTKPNVYEMAKDVGLESFYQSMYTLLSGSPHNDWMDVCGRNIELYKNPLYKGHKIPFVRRDDGETNMSFLQLSARYITLTYELWDKNMVTKCNLPTPLFIAQNFLNKAGLFANPLFDKHSATSL